MMDDGDDDNDDDEWVMMMKIENVTVHPLTHPSIYLSIIHSSPVGSTTVCMLRVVEERVEGRWT